MQQFNNYKPIRLIELFAGIGSQAKALKNLDIEFEHWFVCDFDKYAIKSYNAIHGTDYSTSDITKITAKDLNIVDTNKFTYLLTYSFPCQDLSNAGLGKGMDKGSNTRSGLLWEVERILDECEELPQLLLMENVPQVHGTKHKDNFDKWIAFLESKGYSNYWQDLNAKNYGIPQNRNRCFMVSILGEYSYEFPKPIPLTSRLADLLETEVDEKFYLSKDYIKYALRITEESIGKNNGFKFTPFNRENLEREREYSQDDNEQIRSTSDGQFRTGIQISNQGKTIGDQTDICCTLLARDYKGFGNQIMTGVIEINDR